MNDRQQSAPIILQSKEGRGQLHGGYDINIAYSYRNCIANIIGMSQKENCYLEDLIPVHKLLAYREDFLNCVRSFTGELIKLAKEKQDA